MRGGFLAIAVAAGLAGCGGYTPPPPSGQPGGDQYREIQEGRPGMFGDLRWNIDLKTGERVQASSAAAPSGAAPAAATAASAAEQEEFKKWKESAGSSERQEFEQWRAWQEWKRKNPK